MTDLDSLARLTLRLDALRIQHEEAVAELMDQPDRNVTHIARAAGMTRAGVHKLHKRHALDHPREQGYLT